MFLNIDLVLFRQKKIYRFKKKPKSPKKWAKLTLNGLSNGKVYYSWCYFIQIQPKNLIFQKFNLCDGRADGRMDGRTDGRTDKWMDRRTEEQMDGQTDGPTDGQTAFYGDARKHLKIFEIKKKSFKIGPKSH